MQNSLRILIYALNKVYMLSGHSAAQEIKHLCKFTSGCIGPQIVNFERSLSLSPGPKAVLFRIAKFLSEALLLAVDSCDEERRL
jgi:hypothetical protein